MKGHRLIFSIYCGFIAFLLLLGASVSSSDAGGSLATAAALLPHLPSRKQSFERIIPEEKPFPEDRSASSDDYSGGGGYSDDSGSSSDDDSGSSYSSNHYHRGFGFGFGHHSSGSSYSSGSYGPSHK